VARTALTRYSQRLRTIRRRTRIYELRTRFRAVDHPPQPNISIELGWRLGVTQATAWTVKHKLKQVMLGRDATKQLAGRVDDNPSIPTRLRP